MEAKEAMKANRLQNTKERAKISCRDLEGMECSGTTVKKGIQLDQAQRSIHRVQDATIKLNLITYTAAFIACGMRISSST